MKITVDKKYSDKLLQQIMDDILKKGDRDESKWHVSDCVWPLASYFKRRFGYKDDAEDVGFYFTGVAYHEKIQKILGIENAEIRKELYNVVGTVDYDGEAFLEIKTSRKWTVPDAPPGHYVQQGGYYCAIHNHKSIRIVTIYPTAGRTWKGTKSSTVEVKVWKINFTDADIALIKKDLHLTVAALELALKTKNPKGLPPVPDWKIEKLLKKSGHEKLFKLWRGGFNDFKKQEHPFNFVEMSK